MQKEFRDMNDEQFDKLFQDAAEKFTLPSAPEGAWDRFSKNKLQAHTSFGKKKERPWYRRWLVPVYILPRFSLQLLILCFLFAGVSVWLGMKWSKNTNSVAGVTHSEKVPKETKGNSIAEMNKGKIVVKGSVTNGMAEVSKQKEIGSENHIIETTSTQKVVRVKAGAQEFLKDNFLMPAVVADKLQEMKVAKEKSKTNITQTDKGNPPTKDLATNERQNQNGSQHLQPKQKTLTFFPGSIDLPAEQTTSAANSKWQLGLVAGSNWSTLNGSVAGNAGVNTGVMVQHRINKSRISVETGVVLESMAYNVAPDDFHPNGKVLSASSGLSNIQGKCLMVDIPLNVRYDVVHTKKSNAFVSTGISSMVMTNESYTYQYPDGNGGVESKTKDISGQGKNLYSVSNISVGFEHSWNKTSIQIEPYLKIPLGDVGYGNLGLGSLGTQISIKHNF